MKKLPPYAKPLFELQQNGSRPSNSVNIWIGANAWKKGRAFSASMPSRTIVLPPWLSPFEFYWPVKGCDILINDTGQSEVDYIEDIVCCLYTDGADIVRYVAPNFQLTLFHKD